MTRHRRFRPTVHRLLLAVLAAFFLPIAVVSGSSPAAATQTLLPPSVVAAVSNPNSPNPQVPKCGSVNVDGSNGYPGAATWTVTSSIGSGSTVHPGTTWTVKALLDVRWTNSPGNDGPDPLRVALVPTGPVTPGAPTQGVYDSKWNDGPGATGPIGPHGPWGFAFDANSDPKGGFLNDLGDGVYATTTVTLRATAAGVIEMPQLQVSGYDGTPIAGWFACQLALNWSWTVVNPLAPSVLPEKATVDSRYPASDPSDANGGSRWTVIDVLANDDDPNVAGGPGDLDQVRLAAWQTSSAMGGTVTCGTPAQNGAPKGTPFADLATGPCAYQPPSGYAGPDAFTYTVRTVTGELQTTTAAGITVRPNRAPVATGVVFGTAVNEDAVFDLSAGVGDLDGDPVTCSLASPPAPAVGTALVTPDCSLHWDNTAPGHTGTVSIDYRVCDTHALLVDPDLGVSVTRGPTYAIAPDDLSSTTSRRCSTETVKIGILPGLIIPPTAGTDIDVVDAGYGAEGIGAYTVRIPVLANDIDLNGPPPAVPGVELDILDGPDPSQGTAAVVGDLVTFTPADGYSGPVSFSYRVCEDPLAQNPVYLDDPDTPFIDEGLPYCGVGTVLLDVIGNGAPVAGADEVTVWHADSITGLDVGTNDADPEGGALTCTPGSLVVSDPSLIASATIGADCLVDLDPVDGTDGMATVTYEVCDDHHLSNPAHPAAPYGSDGRSPGAAAGRCSEGTLLVTVVGPAPVQEDPPADGPGETDPDHGDPDLDPGDPDPGEPDPGAGDPDLDSGDPGPGGSGPGGSGPGGSGPGGPDGGRPGAGEAGDGRGGPGTGASSPAGSTRPTGGPASLPRTGVGQRMELVTMAMALAVTGALAMATSRRLRPGLPPRR